MSVSASGGTPRRRPGRALLIVVLGVGLTAVSAVAACQSSPAPDFGAPPASSAPPAVPPVVPPTKAAAPAKVAPAKAPAKAVAPLRLGIPAFDLDATVDAVGVEEKTGDFAVPPSVDRVGWYRFGPGFDADAGSIVVAGHVDAADQGKGAFFKLGTLASGERVTLTGPGGKTRAFEVTARKRYSKTAIPLEKYFARDGDTRLTLITCGGPFDPETRHYRDNVVVTAVPVN